MNPTKICLPKYIICISQLLEKSDTGEVDIRQCELAKSGEASAPWPALARESVCHFSTMESRLMARAPSKEPSSDRDEVPGIYGAANKVDLELGINLRFSHPCTWRQRCTKLFSPLYMRTRYPVALSPRDKKHKGGAVKSNQMDLSRRGHSELSGSH